mmetsp:Transcript_26423/g.76249  ORF Transcript_26423/g.76249 Transcript_26423/m.76249 type:complete len:139 (-) Transcript_26423:1668-2084(-)
MMRLKMGKGSSGKKKEEVAAAPPPPPAPKADAVRRNPPPAAVHPKPVPAKKSPEVKVRKEASSSVEKVHVQQAGADRAALKELPALRDAAPAKREELFILKLKLCSVIFSFDDPTADKRGKDMKRQTLLELVDVAPTG